MSLNEVATRFHRRARFAFDPVDGRALLRLRRVFAAIWLVYDILDLILEGTARTLAPFGILASGPPSELVYLQCLLIVAEACVVTERWTLAATWAACALRLYQAHFVYGLNDFFFAGLMFAWLAFTVGRDHSVPRWVHEGVRLQTAWIYLATGILKLNPFFLSGQHLYVRHVHLIRHQHWPVPQVLAEPLCLLAVNHVLAIAAVTMELTLAFVLAQGRHPKLARALALMIHVFAALTVDVFFFGASMIAVVWFSVEGRTSRAPE